MAEQFKKITFENEKALVFSLTNGLVRKLAEYYFHMGVLDSSWVLEFVQYNLDLQNVLEKMVVGWLGQLPPKQIFSEYFGYYRFPEDYWFDKKFRELLEESGLAKVSAGYLKAFSDWRLEEADSETVAAEFKDIQGYLVEAAKDEIKDKIVSDWKRVLEGRETLFPEFNLSDVLDKAPRIFRDQFSKHITWKDVAEDLIREFTFGTEFHWGTLLSSLGYEITYEGDKVTMTRVKSWEDIKEGE